MRRSLVPTPLGMLTAVLATALATVLVSSEVLHARASRRDVEPPHVAGGREAIVVLGYRNRGRTANYLNRYRVRAALRSISPHADDTVLVLCGGITGAGDPEADVLLRYARGRRGYAGKVRLDRSSLTTWENIQNAIPLIEDRDTIKIVSNSLHAEKARAYLREQRPDLAERLVRAEDYRAGEITLVKPIAAIVGLARRQVRD